MSCCDEKPNTLTPFPDALAAALGSVSQLETEPLAYQEALGRVLREPVHCDRDLPGCTRSRMDGYALRANEYQPNTPVSVVGEIRAGDSGAIDVPKGACVKIATGAPLPEGLDTVIEHERSDRCNPVTFSLEELEAGRSLHVRGVDARAGEVVVKAGTLLRAQHIGLAATVGATTLTVTRLPRMIVLSSGDELVDACEVPLPHQVREGNAPMIQAVLKEFGVGHSKRVHLADDPGVTRTALEDAAAQHDLIVTIGGISAGEHDFIRPVLESLGVQWDVARANIKPGRPIHIGHASSGSVVCCLPGNPVSALVCAHLFLRPMIGKLLGRNNDPAWSMRALTSEVKPDLTRWSFRPAHLEQDGSVRIPNWHGSGDLAHLTSCTGILELPPGNSVHTEGTKLRFLDWGNA